MQSVMFHLGTNAFGVAQNFSTQLKHDLYHKCWISVLSCFDFMSY